ncbi:MAG TPA: S8 family serine peptidase, partial [Jatrophihabitantaceae bacterium]|nr:S8 family serine peptidase [Jatrophihabitantaceae bacterium]
QLRCRRPVVAVLDTGCGTHPWLDPYVLKNPSIMGVPLGLQDPGTAPDNTGVIADPWIGQIDPVAGHGTFIAGLIRQTCPDANIMAIRVMDSEGAVAESELLNALKRLYARQCLAQAANDARGVIDVVSLSLGYYHELPEDWSFDPQLMYPLRGLSECGVSAVVAAGNDSTDRPMFPAAFYPHAGGVLGSLEHDCVPLISVGALNPDRTIALFSNAGSWVACHYPGSGLVSTFPVTFDGADQPSIRFYAPGDGWRGTIDPDDFSAGFGVWSGTSFAAPILAGEIAQQLFSGKCGSIDPADKASTVDRTWNAVTACIGVTRP